MGNVFAFIVVLGVLIFFHELGHFLVARLFGVGVEKFSLGFGPKILGKTVGITEYRLSAVPLGGYVKMVGEEPDAELDPADIPISFTHKSVYKRILIVAAGPLFNLLLAVIIFFFIFQVSGMYILRPVVGQVTSGSPAEAAGFQPEDRVTAIDGETVETWGAMAEMISTSRGKRLRITVDRHGFRVDLTVTPQLTESRTIFGETIDRYTIGIVAAGKTDLVDIGFFAAVKESFVQTYAVAKLTVVSIVKLIQGTLSVKTLGGPIMIAQMAGEQAKAGAGALIFFIALISVNLAVINFLPIPVLDGGHLMFFFIEAVTGKPVSLKMREMAQRVGIFVLVLLMIFVFYNDIARILFS
ncbi:MAG: RIP metalloprotease RseP [Deltaproteobacteria bacterium]|nr:RIP metalloprotease RseP [Deltaproteobacteria bacterium]MBW1956465.1 RIP metalloprotease RseP [Deltaproteobacteria bacterium]MBW2042792.1 RIP metalloprotease RseP [Deltaproteobacteria bacterium]MBW2132911.1 RIP metalloprotease RseP [Deltaproteobacteria bacterium]